MTNYEKIIASLTPVRLAKEIEAKGCAACPVVDIEEGKYCKPDNCPDCIVEWLNMEAK
ncbi:MAG: hypothetical protein Q4E34_05940 [Synergistaceae bacterium]|nr:hypothetical protein [Synergistaceae bacterium]